MSRSTNATSSAVSGQLTGAGSSAAAFSVKAGASHSWTVDPIATTQGWYDLAVTLSTDSTYLRRFAGHVENGKPSITG